MSSQTALLEGLRGAVVELEAATPIRWEDLGDDQAWDLLVARPKMLGRWSRPTSRRFVRRDPDGNRAIAVEADHAGAWVVLVCSSWSTRARRLACEGPRKSFPSAAAAIAAVDAELRSQGVRLLEGGDEGLAVEGAP